jgi:hypothetical protein
MIGTMRKHSTWLWSIIIVVVVFAFVIWGTNPGSMGGGGRNAVYGSINGQPITEEDFLAAQREVYLRYWLRSGQWPDAEAERRGLDIPRETFSLLLLIQKLEQRKMFAGPEAKATVAGQLLRGLKSEGINTLADFEKAVLARQGLSLTDLDRLIEHEIAMRQLTSVEGLSGQLITPQLIESFWQRENQEIETQAVFFSASNYLQAVEVTPEALSKFFTNQMARYRIPERIQVSYVAYPISNFLAQAEQRLSSITNLEAQIEQEYQRRGTNTFADLTADEAKTRIREELRQQATLMEARQAAALFADELWRQEPLSAANLETYGAQKGLAVKTSAPFDQTGTPAELDVDAAFTRAAFQLRPDEPFAGPLVGEENVYVIAEKRRIPSENARFEEVKDQVERDYRLQQAILKAREAGSAFAQVVTNSLALNDSFAEACRKASLPLVDVPPFSRSTPSLPAVESYTSAGLYKQAAFATPVGSASGLKFTSDGGFIVYVESQVPVDEARMQQELPQYTQFVRRSLEGEAFSAWFSQEAQVGLSQTPLGRTPPPQLSPPGS